MSPSYTPIDCVDYDFIEIACMYGYQLDVVMHSGTITGKAITTEKNANGEYLILENDEGTRESIRADEILKLIVLDSHAKFSERIFKQPSN